MNDDFNTPEAVGIMFELASEVNKTHHAKLSGELKALGAVLNILQLNPDTFLKGATEGLDEAAIEAKIQARAQAKKDKNWGLQMRFVRS